MGRRSVNSAPSFKAPPTFLNSRRASGSNQKYRASKGRREKLKKTQRAQAASLDSIGVSFGKVILTTTTTTNTCNYDYDLYYHF